ncbi:tyrosyl-DNA phosphodiesterase-domain-containing protein [Dipodascopsis tothii]|uniref:tyrosyl-DNA phosphodiesterase-domain-containing protein n=1 Tax=Dipodascopsis tothii TaxID=44089 RepID=UPI0034CE0BC5
MDSDDDIVEIRAPKSATGPSRPKNQGHGGQRSTASAAVIDLDDDDSDGAGADVRAASSGRGGVVAAETAASAAPELPAFKNFLAGLDRTAMERERLARAGVRTAPEAAVMPHEQRLGGGPRGTKRDSRDSDDDSADDAEEPVPDLTIRQTATWFGSKKLRISGRDAEYVHGVVKKTFVQGYARADNQIRIEEVLRKDDVRTAVLSSFQWDFDWLFTKTGLGAIDLVLVVQAKGEEERHSMKTQLESLPRVRVCLPPMRGQTFTMHSKLMLLFYDDYLRVAVPSANLTDYDWGEAGGVLENMVYIHDFPRLPQARPQPAHMGRYNFGKYDVDSDIESNATDHDTGSVLPPFQRELLYFIKRQGMPADVVRAVLEDYDFSQTADVRFVHSVGGDSKRACTIDRTGFPGLASAIHSLGLGGADARVDFLISSLGNISPEFLRTMYRAACGNAIVNGRSILPRQGRAISDSLADIERRFRVYFPTHDTVAASKPGPMGAGTVCFQVNYWQNPNFPRAILRDGRSVRPGCLMHNKVMFVRPDDIKDTDDRSWLGYAYVGSANMSESAWGKLVNNRKTKTQKLMLRNWECGVLIRVPKPAQAGNTDMSIESIFGDRIPVPMETRNTAYNGREPWFFMDRKNYV